MSVPRNPYEVLGVDSKAALNEIRSAYRRLAIEYHPDYNSAEDAGDRFKEIQWAYELLSDTRARARFDEGVPAEEIVSVVDIVPRDAAGSPGASEPEQTWREHWHVWIAEKDEGGEKVLLHKDSMPFFKRWLAQLHGKNVQGFEWGFSVLQCRPDLDGCRWRAWRPTSEEFRKYQTDALYMMWKRQEWEQTYQQATGAS